LSVPPTLRKSLGQFFCFFVGKQVYLLTSAYSNEETNNALATRTSKKIVKLSSRK